MTKRRSDLRLDPDLRDLRDPERERRFLLERERERRFFDLRLRERRFFDLRRFLFERERFLDLLRFRDLRPFLFRDLERDRLFLRDLDRRREERRCEYWNISFENPSGAAICVVAIE